MLQVMQDGPAVAQLLIFVQFERWLFLVVSCDYWQSYLIIIIIIIINA